VGEAGQASLDRVGIRLIGDLLRWDRRDLHARFGSMGERLWHLSRGEDHRPVRPDRDVKSVSNETTFHADTADRDLLDGHVWRLSEKVSSRLKAHELAGGVVTLKLKLADHQILTRRAALRQPTQVADTIYRSARALLDEVPELGPFRLLGVGLSEIGDARDADREADLLDPDAARRAAAERAADAIRARWGDGAIVKGRALR
jgi:DNA polymerase-4